MTHPIPQPQIRGYFVVRDKDGRPRIDDPLNCPAGMLVGLTPAEREEVFARVRALMEGGTNADS